MKMYYINTCTVKKIYKVLIKSEDYCGELLLYYIAMNFCKISLKYEMTGKKKDKDYDSYTNSYLQ